MKPRVLFIHGFPFCRKVWERLENLLVDKLDLLLIDLPGYGLEPPISYFSISQVAIYIYQKYLMNEKYVIVGHSMAGYIALAIGEYFPHCVEKIILLHSHPLPDNPSRRLNRIKSLKEVDENIEDFLKKTAERLSNIPYKELKKYMIFSSSEVLKQSMLAMADRPERTHVLQKIKTLIIHGTRDSFLPIDEVKEKIVNKGLALYAEVDSMHMSMLETPHSLSKIILDFAIN